MQAKLQKVAEQGMSKAAAVTSAAAVVGTVVVDKVRQPLLLAL
jgi:hypothetical protein